MLDQYADKKTDTFDLKLAGGLQLTNKIHSETQAKGQTEGIHNTLELQNMNESQEKMLSKNKMFDGN